MNVQNTSTKQIPLGLRTDNLQSYTVFIAERSGSDIILAKQYLNAFEFKIIGQTTDYESVVSSIISTSQLVDFVFLGYYVSGKVTLPLIQAIRSHSPDTKIVFLVDELYREEATKKLTQLSLNSIINKPVTRTQMVEVLARLLNRKELLPKFIDTNAPKKGGTLNFNELSIPPLPEVTNKIIMFELDPVGGSDKLEQIILPDKGISADILRVANSAFFGRSGKVQNLKEAITLLGLKSIKNIAMLQAKRAINKDLIKEPIFKKVLFEKQILASLVAFDMCHPLGLKNLKEQIFTPSNFLNSGMLILALNRVNDYRILLAEHLKTGKEIKVLEQEKFGISSKDVGLYVFKAWNMPAKILEVMKNSAFDKEQMLVVNDLDRIIRLGDIAARMLLGFPISDEDLEISKLILEHYKADSNLLENFGGDYFETIKSHPYFDLLNS
jgi:HD-like signal output (HDOD) protein